jgi:cytochrome c peroxidase
MLIRISLIALTLSMVSCDTEFHNSKGQDPKAEPDSQENTADREQEGGQKDPVLTDPIVEEQNPTPSLPGEPVVKPDGYDNDSLRLSLSNWGISTPPADSFLQGTLEQFQLGKTLFFATELSGDRRTSCSSCHIPQKGTGDALSLRPAETAPDFYWQDALHAPTQTTRRASHLLSRNVPPLYYRGHQSFTRMFWDSRVEQSQDGHGQGTIHSPAKQNLPSRLNSALAAQALFPLLACAEMRGCGSDSIVPGAASDQEVWQRITAQIMATFPDQVQAAYPDRTSSSLTIADLANAIAVFQSQNWGRPDSALDRFLELFVGRARCASCHSGPLLTNHNHFNIGVPQVGSGKNGRGTDFGWGDLTNRSLDQYTFRTPSLRNVSVTAPYGHNGAYGELRDMVRHYKHLNVAASNYQPHSQMRLIGETLWYAGLAGNFLDLGIERTLSLAPIEISDEEIDQLTAFLLGLSDSHVLVEQLSGQQ